MKISVPRLIFHIVVVWDESLHLSTKNSKKLSDGFLAGYLASFPEGSQTAESPVLIASRSPIFGLDSITAFSHEGTFIPHSGKNKDLAIVKFCSSGFVDQSDKFHFVLNDLREMRQQRGDPPMQADSAATTVLVTSDHGTGMTNAIEWAVKPEMKHRTNFTCLRLDQELASGQDRMAKAGYLLGHEFRQMYVGVERGALLLNLVDRTN